MKLRVLVALCILACIAVPLAAQIVPGGASPGGDPAGHPETNVCTTVTAAATARTGDLIPLSGPETDRYTLAPGEKRFFTAPVRAGMSHHWLDICWNTPGEKVTLLVHGPDGSLGPYINTDDGLRNGRIFLDVSSPGGLASGNWYYEVGRPDGNGPVEFTFETYGR